MLLLERREYRQFESPLLRQQVPNITETIVTAAKCATLPRVSERIRESSVLTVWALQVGDRLIHRDSRSKSLDDSHCASRPLAKNRAANKGDPKFKSLTSLSAYPSMM
jgi:hypothetical protein